MDIHHPPGASGKLAASHPCEATPMLSIANPSYTYSHSPAPTSHLPSHNMHALFISRHLATRRHHCAHYLHHRMSLRKTPYSSPVAVSMYPTFGGVLMLVGFIFMAVYFIYQLNWGDKRSIAVELSIGGVSSLALGFGALFVMLSFGLYV